MRILARRPNTDLKFRTDSSTPKQVSKYSLAWAIIALATNTMSQPAGRVCDAPSEIGIALRSSPVICALDTCYIFKRILFDGFLQNRRKKTHKETHEVMRAFLEHRFRSNPISGSDFDSGYEELRQHTRWRWVLFALAASQAVKLYGLRGPGLLWVKVVGSTYICSFLAIEVFAWLLQEDEILIKSPTSLKFKEVSGAATLPIISSMVAAVPVFSLMAYVLPYLFTAVRWNTLRCTGWSLAIVGFPILFLCFFFSIKFHGPPKTGESKISWVMSNHMLPFLLLLVMVGTPSLFIWAFPDWAFNSRILIFFLSLGWASIAAILGDRMFTPLVKSTEKDLQCDKKKLARVRCVEKTMAVYFGVITLTVTALYFQYVYSPTGTFQPGWTEPLG